LRTELGSVTIRQAAAGEPPLELKRFGRGPTERMPAERIPKGLKGLKGIQPVEQ
jgi:hypothetical protein